VNTLVVDGAHRLGLGQLHQLRGRVGRSGQRAYAYLFHPRDQSLTEDAYERLRTIGESTELGSGFKIAMRDLEIRGAGNLLGDEQSGHVAALGFELYLAMLDEAVRAMDGAPADDEPEPVRLDVNVDAYVPADYVPYEQAKVDVHRRVAAARDVADLATLRDELEDRFGPVPEPLDNLIALQQARIKLGRAGARAVSFRGETLAATPLELTSEQADELRERVPGARYEPGRSQVSFRVPRDAEGRFRIVVSAADGLLAVTAPVGDLTAA
jgi:transcription-repair coupling factor (superfamily II helicase)